MKVGATHAYALLLCLFEVTGCASQPRGPACTLLMDKSPQWTIAPPIPVARPVRVFQGEVLTESQASERLAYKDDAYPPHRTGTYAAYAHARPCATSRREFRGRRDREARRNARALQ